MSLLKPGTLCVIVGGCPANIGLTVEVLAHLGPCPPRADVYSIRTVSGQPFNQFWDSDGHLIRGYSNETTTDRHKLVPLVDSKDESEARSGAVKRVGNRKRELATCP